MGEFHFEQTVCSAFVLRGVTGAVPDAQQETRRQRQRLPIRLRKGTEQTYKTICDLALQYFIVSLNKWLTIDKLTYSINVLDLSRPR